MKKRTWLYVYLGLFVTTPFLVSGCAEFMWPTVKDVNALTRADHEFVAEEHKAICDQMTDEHAIQTPALAADLVAINDNYMAVVTKLRERVDAVEAKGASVGGLNGGFWAIIGAMFPGLAGVGLWFRNLVKPSRAAGAVSSLETNVLATSKELSDLKLALAKSAATGELLPSGNTD